MLVANRGPKRTHLFEPWEWAGGGLVAYEHDVA